MAHPHGGVRWSFNASAHSLWMGWRHALPNCIVGALLRFARVAQCSTFEASNVSKVKRRNHNAVRQSVTSPHSKWKGRSVEASTHAAVWTGRYCDISVLAMEDSLFVSFQAMYQGYFHVCQCEKKFLESTCPWTSKFVNLLVRIHFSLVQNGHKLGPLESSSSPSYFTFSHVFTTQLT